MPPAHAPKPSQQTQPRSFTFAEKWIIWSVFCLLLALSTHWLFFAALQLLAWGVVRWRWQASQKTAFVRRWPAMIAFAAGAALFYHAAVLLRP